jgi:hypothetical protein
MISIPSINLILVYSFLLLSYLWFKMETHNLESKNLEVLGNNQVPSISMNEQQSQNVALPERGSNAITTEADLQKQQELQQAMVKTEIEAKYCHEELSLSIFVDSLSKTIYEDTETKTILFLMCLLTFTAEEQRNAILTGQSSVGKTHNLTEILWFFRGIPNLIMEINDASPRSFIHQANAVMVDGRTLKPIDLSQIPKKGDPKEVWDEYYDQRRNIAYYLSLSGKIINFLDLPNFKLLESLRTLLSHDRKISKYLITDKDSKGLTKTKTVLIEGFFTALFASAYGEMDEQELSRNYLLSPTDNPAKIRKAIELQAKKKTDPNYKQWYETEPSRLGLKKRVNNIQAANIKNIQFKEVDMANLTNWFFSHSETLAPKAQRDFPRLYSLAEAWALLNFEHREFDKETSTLYVNSTDIEVAKQIYEPILRCNELGLTPEEFDIWKIIEPNCNEVMGLRINEIHNLYYYQKKHQCSDKRLRDMLKNLVRAGLLKEEKEGVIIKYYPITHKETKQSGLALSTLPLEKVESNPLFQRQGTPSTTN